MRKKQKSEILIVLVFLIVLTGAAVSGASDIRSLGQVKEALRGIRRVDNLHYVYADIISGQNTSETSRTEVWADQLTGSWRAEYSTIDEDGEWMFLRKYCDGKKIYSENQWEDMEEEETLEIPNMDELTMLPYSAKDILEESIEEEKSGRVISYVFTPDYREEILAENKEELEQMWLYRTGSEAGEANENLFLEQYQNTEVSEASVKYWLDKEGVLQKKEMTFMLLRPRIEFTADGKKILGEQETICIMTQAEILEYNAEKVTENLQPDSKAE